MCARGVEVLDVFAVSLIADRAEAFAHHRFCKAGDGVERIADIVTYFGDEFRLGRRGALRLARGSGGWIVRPGSRGVGGGGGGAVFFLERAARRRRLGRGRGRSRRPPPRPLPPRAEC